MSVVASWHASSRAVLSNDRRKIVLSLEWRSTVLRICAIIVLQGRNLFPLFMTDHRGDTVLAKDFSKRDRLLLERKEQ